MNDYIKSVENFAKMGENAVFGNKGKEHASIVVSTIFNYAKYDVMMYSGNLSKTVTGNGEFKKSLENMIQKGISFRILLDNIPKEEEQSEALKLILENKDKSNVIIKIMNDDSTKIINDIFDQKYHFTISDDKSYRLETNSSEFTAYCNFNDPDVAGKLENLFQLMFDKADYI